ISFLIMLRHPTISTLFPYTTLFRSESKPVPSQLTHDKYVYGIRDVVYYQQLTDERWDIKRFMDWVSNDENTFRTLIKKQGRDPRDRKSTRLNSSHVKISYAVFCLRK